MNSVLVEGFGWVYVVLVLDWYTKQSGGSCGGGPHVQALVGGSGHGSVSSVARGHSGSGGLLDESANFTGLHAGLRAREEHYTMVLPSSASCTSCVAPSPWLSASILTHVLSGN